MTQTQLRPLTRDGNYITYEEFLEMDLEGLWEWEDGKAIQLSVDARHDAIFGFLHTLLSVFVDTHALGRLLTEPFQMKTGVDLPGRSPDIFFVSTGNLPRIQLKHLRGPADLAIEIV